jgi:diguanylate cyclase (GGDEF)-like protein/PAS domain S-box-containing protein
MSDLGSLRLEEDRRSELLFQSVTDYSIHMLDTHGLVSTWNPGSYLITGYTEDEVIGKHFSVFYAREDLESGEPDKRLEIAIEFGRSENEGWCTRRDGSRLWASVVIAPVYEKGNLLGFATVMRDVSRDHDADERFVQAHRNLEIALTHMCQGLVLYDTEGRLILANNRLSEMFSIPPDQIRIGMSISEVMAAVGFSCRRSKKMQSRIQTLRPYDDPDHAREESKTGRIVSISTRRMPESGWVTTFEDVTERQRAETKLEHLAHNDTLTGLPNRKLFRIRLKEAIAQMKRGIPFALFILDIKDFSSINDTLGQVAGDELLRSFARRIKDHVREIDMVARLDGDEFAIIQQGPELVRDTEVLASRLLEICKVPHSIANQSVISNLNIGIALSTGDGADADELLKNADKALCRAKQSALPSYNFFNPQLDKDLQSRRALERDLSKALSRDEFRLDYQALTDTQTGIVKGYEALLRWQHPLRGWISPEEFIPIAEEFGHIVAIGEWVLRTACDEAASWPSHLRLAVNLSPVQFEDGTLSEIVLDALTISGLDANRLELEITETLLLTDSESNLTVLERLRKLGIRIALDDFGIGYSSLSYLRQFHFDKLKIDRSFVRDLPESDAARAIVTAIIGLGSSFNIGITAEGVETQDQLDFLRERGCQEVQGFFIARPCPAEEIFRAAKALIPASSPSLSTLRL